MKTYLSPKCEVIKLSLTESLLLTGSDLKIHNQVGSGQYSEKKGSWDSSAWTEDTEEE